MKKQNCEVLPSLHLFKKESAITITFSQDPVPTDPCYVYIDCTFWFCEKGFNDYLKNYFTLSVNVNNKSSKKCAGLVGLKWIKTIMNFWKAFLDNSFWNEENEDYLETSNSH